MNAHGPSENGRMEWTEQGGEHVAATDQGTFVVSKRPTGEIPPRYRWEWTGPGAAGLGEESGEFGSVEEAKRSAERAYARAAER